MRIIKRMMYNFRAISKYTKERGIESIDLTPQELEQFETRPLIFGAETSHSVTPGNCYICKDETKYLDNVHTVYLCSEKCMKIADEKYESGEEIVRNEEAYNRLVEVQRDLFM